MPSYAWDRMANGLPMSGVVVALRGRSPGEAGHAIADEVSLRPEFGGWFGVLPGQGAYAKRVFPLHSVFEADCGVG